MKHKAELAAALKAAENALADLPVSTVLIVTEIGHHGLQIALSDKTDPAVVREALRGAADQLDGKARPIIGEIRALMRARGWQPVEGGWTHPRLAKLELPSPCTLVEALASQTVIERKPTPVEQADIDVPPDPAS